MGRKKKSGGSEGVVGILFLGAIALLASIPKEVWIGIGVIVGLGAIGYLYNKSQQKKQADILLAESARLVEESAQLMQQVRSKNRPAASTARRFVEDAEPVAVSLPPVSTSSSFRVPAAPKDFGPATWIPAGQPVAVGGAAIPGGMIYVGTLLKTPSGSNDPCLIDPSKSVAARGDYREGQMGYWPSYSDISASNLLISIQK